MIHDLIYAVNNQVKRPKMRRRMKEAIKHLHTFDRLATFAGCRIVRFDGGHAVTEITMSVRIRTSNSSFPAVRFSASKCARELLACERLDDFASRLSGGDESDLSAYLATTRSR